MSICNVHLPSSPKFAETAPSLASREIPLKSLASCRGAHTTSGRNPRSVVFESGQEEKTFLAASARSDVSNIVDQFGPFPFVLDGETRHHTFDFAVDTQDGRRIALAVKPRARAEAQDLLSQLRTIASQMSPEIADAIVLVTEDKLPRDLVHNARLFHAVRHDPPSLVDDKIKQIAASLEGSVTIEDLVACSGEGGAAFRAVVRLIAAGFLQADANARIDYDTPVRRAEQPGGAK